MYPFQHSYVFFKEPWHLQFFSEFGISDIYVSLVGKKKSKKNKEHKLTMDSALRYRLNILIDQ